LYTDRGMRAGALILAILFAGLAMLTRTVGIVLLPALLAGLIWHHRVVLARYRKVIGLTVLLAVAGAVAFWKGPDLGLYMNSVRSSGPGWMVLLREHLAEWGQLLLNAPVGKIAGIGRGATIWLFLAAGLFLIFAVSYSLVRRRKKVPVAAGVYLVLYSLLIFYWPFFDMRFLIPVAPLVVMILLYGRSVRGFRLPAALYILAGVVAMGYSIYTAFDKEALARTQAGGRYRNEYEIYFFGKPLRDSVAPADPYVLHILETCK